MFPAFLPSNSKFWSIHASNIFATVHIVRHSRTPKWTVQVWRTPKQRFFWFYREGLLEHCACWRCFSISKAWNWDGLGMIRKSVGVRACTRPQCGPIAFIKSKRFKKFQKLDSVHMFPAFLPSNSKFWSIHASNIFATVHIVRHSRTPKWTVQVWRTPKQRFFWFYREGLLEHCACWRCFSISIAWNWDGLGMIRKPVGVRACTRPQCGPIAFIKSNRFKKFQKLDSVHMFPAFLPSNSKFWSIHASNIFATVHIVRHSRTPKWTVQVWRTPKQRFFWFYREVLLEHCACWRCFSIIYSGNQVPL